MTTESTDYVYSIIRQLEHGAPHGDSVSCAALLLERANQLKTGLEDFDAIEVTKKQAEGLKQALQYALASHPPLDIRGGIIHALALTSDPGLKKLFTRELRSMKAAMLETSAAMYQVNLALERLGEDIFPEDFKSRSSMDVEMNWKCSERYLERGDTEGPPAQVVKPS